MKKYISLLLLVITATLGLTGQNTIGQWRHFPAFAPPASDIAVAGDMVYYVAGGSLFSYDSRNDESRSYSTSGLLCDSHITMIRYNPIGRYLLVAYRSGNIDLIYDDGERVVNFPDISESGITGDKSIIDVDFAPDRAYIATAFGLIEYDDTRHEVAQAGIYGNEVCNVMVMGDHLMIYVPHELRVIRRGERFNDLSKFTGIQGSAAGFDAFPLSDRRLLIRRPNYPDLYLNVYQYDDDMTTMLSRTPLPGFREGLPLIKGADGTVYFVSGGELYAVDAENLVSEHIGSFPDDIMADRIAIGRSASEVWALGTSGLTRYDLTGSAPVVTMQRYIPERLSVNSVAFLRQDPLTRGIYAFNLGPTVYRGAGQGEGLDVAQQTAVITPDGQFRDVAAYSYVSPREKVRNWQKAIGVNLPIAPTCVAPHPTDPDTYFLGTGNDGLLRITDGEVTGRYDDTNSPIVDSWTVRVFGAAFDPAGNLWVTQIIDKDQYDPIINILPASKVDADPETLTAADWISLDIPDYRPGKDITIHHSKRHNMVFIFGQNMQSGLLVIDTRGTWDNIADDRYLIWKSFVDQDGKVFEPDRLTALLEDSRGRIWLGTSRGVIELTNPAAAVDPSMTVNHIKVPRNDGTNSADYLLDADCIYCIAEDHAGRKWLATEMSGLYLVSTTGAEILDHFTSSNSILTSNMIHAVCASPDDNTVWIGTSEGLYAYTSDATPAMPDYDDVKVYPNPVRPDFTGLLTISGLMDGTLLKIADASGHVVAQLRSEGGMATWNCENESGRRVPSGVYFVMLSSGNGVDGGPTSGAVAKFLIVN